MVLWPSSLAPFGDINGLNVVYLKADSVQIDPGYACNDVSYDYMISSGAITVSLAASGEFGLDVGVEAADTWYYVWLIGDVENGTVAGIFSLSATAPTLPGAYTLKRRLGEVRNDAAGDILEFFQCGAGNRRRVHWLIDPEVAAQVLTGGNQIAWTAVDCSGLIPPVACIASLWSTTRVKGTEYRPTGTTARMKVIYKDRDETFDMLTDTNQSIDYQQKAGGGSVDIAVAGYILNL